jgi:subtilisin family serine protease
MIYDIKKIILGTILTLSVPTANAVANGGLSTFQSAKIQKHEVLVRFENSNVMHSMLQNKTIENLLGKNSIKTVYKNMPVVLIHTDALSLQGIIKKLQTLSGIKTIAPNYQRHIIGEVNDEYYPKLWGINNIGQDNGTQDADIDGKEAWDIQEGSKNVVVAVVDTGIDYNHPDLAENMWDGTAYNIPNHGWDFAGDSNGNNDDDPNPGDDSDLEHGTHVAGTIGAIANNNIGVAGVSQHVSLMAVKVFRPNGYGYDSDILEGMDFLLGLLNQGVNIVSANASYGGGGNSDVMKDAIDDLGKKGLIFCAAAGNSSDNIDSDPQYPASYDLANIISIAATDRNDELASFSNYGKKNVDIAAPGVAITSTTPNNNYATWSGTSMATPHVTSTVALLAAQKPNSTIQDRINAILSSADKLKSLDGKVATSGRLNAKKALEMIEDGVVSNHTPQANAGDDQEDLEKNTEVTLDGSNSTDLDDDTLTYKWIFTSKPSGSNAQLDNPNSINPKFIADKSGTYKIKLIVSDGEDSNSDTVTIKVKYINTSDNLLGDLLGNLLGDQLSGLLGGVF